LNVNYGKTSLNEVASHGLGDYLVADEERNQKKIFEAEHCTVVTPPDRNATRSLTDVADQALPRARVLPRALGLPASMASYRLSSTAATRSRLSRGAEIARSTTAEKNSQTLSAREARDPLRTCTPFHG
jgi:hypothetical protein